MLSQYPTEEAHADGAMATANCPSDSAGKNGENDVDQNGTNTSCILSQNDGSGHSSNLDKIEEPLDEVVELSKDTKSVF